MLSNLVKVLAPNDSDKSAINTPTIFLVKNPQCLMPRHFELFVAFTTVEYVVVNLLSMILGTRFCNNKINVREQFTKEVNIFVCGSFSLYIVLNIVRLINGVAYSKTPSMRQIYYSALFVTCIATISSGTTLISTSRLCVDAYG